MSVAWGLNRDDLTDRMQAAIEWGFGKAIHGLPGEQTVEELAAQYRREYRDNIEAAITNYLRWQIAKAASVGFLSNIGGVVTLPVGVPANVTGAFYIHLRLIAVIAALRGYDPRDDRIKTLAISCLAGDAVFDILKDAGIAIGTRLSVSALRGLSGAVLTQINRAVGFRLVTKFGSTGIVNLGKAIPFVGGVLGGTFDAASTQLLAGVARKVFVRIEGSHETDVPYRSSELAVTELPTEDPDFVVDTNAGTSRVGA